MSARPPQLLGDEMGDDGLDAADSIYTDTRTVSSTGSANPSSYNGTFRWAVPGAAIQPGTSFSVGLYEIDDSLNGTPLPSTPPRLPSSGEVSLGVDNDTYEIDVVLVPIRWVYGGNDRTPNLNATNVETIRRTIWERNPAAQINICLLYTSPSPRDGLLSRMPSSA